MRESDIQRSILMGIGARPGIRLFRNSVGVARLASGGALRFGLCPGSSDLIGWRTTYVPDGPVIAQFLAIEVKAASGRLTEEQSRFLDAVRRAGGVAIEARGLEDVERALRA